MITVTSNTASKHLQAVRDRFSAIIHRPSIERYTRAQTCARRIVVSSSGLWKMCPSLPFGMGVVYTIFILRVRTGKAKGNEWK